MEQTIEVKQHSKDKAVIYQEGESVLMEDLEMFSWCINGTTTPEDIEAFNRTIRTYYENSKLNYNK